MKQVDKKNISFFLFELDLCWRKLKSTRNKDYNNFREYRIPKCFRTDGMTDLFSIDHKHSFPKIVLTFQKISEF